MNKWTRLVSFTGSDSVFVSELTNLHLLMFRVSLKHWHICSPPLWRSKGTHFNCMRAFVFTLVCRCLIVICRENSFFFHSLLTWESKFKLLKSAHLSIFDNKFNCGTNFHRICILSNFSSACNARLETNILSSNKLRYHEWRLLRNSMLFTVVLVLK
jgi:hypothetical protein